MLTESPLYTLHLATATSQAVEKRGYEAVTFFERPTVIRNIVGGLLIGALGAAMLAIRENDHRACLSVQNNNRQMQRIWDINHPDGYIPVGGQMRPIDFDCSKYEKPFHPLHHYEGADLY
ncbi:hypothetical protein BCV70DRAFT_214517 [Testicularia cyperi]|uniref:Uncharacterized protein n=1 Tax=Testicularia cyperi TaxID=1882483 RepID=A0A317XYN0_9BASI|nr:hypothetical protein BCV70DRAFT_214517 [Testicularia cyperi]